MKTDLEIQKDVIEELKWDASLNAPEIGVTVKNGIVTLYGQVENFAKKLAAEKAAKKIAGVKAIAEDIQIGVSPLSGKTDTEIAAAVVNALKWHDGLAGEKIKASVEDGIVLLEGEVDWEYLRAGASTAVQNLTGVKGVVNLVKVTPKFTSNDIYKKINEAFHRSATIDARKIVVESVGDKVCLTGRVRSLAEKEDAELAAWNAPGVGRVESKLKIELPDNAV